MINKLYQPTMDGNPFYKVASDTGFNLKKSTATLQQAFNSKLNEIISLTAETLAPITSITQTAEIFHYAALSAALLQRKAKYKADRIFEDATPKEYLTALLNSQFGNEPMIDELSDSYYSPYSDTSHKVVINEMRKDFMYIGCAYRALASISLLSHSMISKNNDVNEALCCYSPTALLIGSVSQEFSVIGAYYTESTLERVVSRSPSRIDSYRLKNQKNDFGKLFASKLSELFAADGMDEIDRARIEELRDYYTDQLTRLYFNLRAKHFTRALSLALSVSMYTDKNGWISEDTVNQIAPEECETLLGNENILIRDYGDVDMPRYKLSRRFESFSALSKRFNLLSGHRLALLDEVVSRLNTKTTEY